MADASRRARLAMALAVGAVLLGGIVAALVVDGDGQERGVGLRAGGPSASTSSTSSSTTSTPSTTSTTVQPSTTSTTMGAVVPAQTIPVAPTPSTTTAPPPTTTPPPARSFGVEPPVGPVGTKARAFGSGCIAPDGSATGVSLTFFDPSGSAVTGDGTSARPDGSWELPFGYPSGPAGEWSVEAACRAGNGPTVFFTYPARATYRLT